jgi:hypothetical protein
MSATDKGDEYPPAKRARGGKEGLKTGEGAKAGGHSAAEAANGNDVGTTPADSAPAPRERAGGARLLLPALPMDMPSVGAAGPGAGAPRGGGQRKELAAGGGGGGGKELAAAEARARPSRTQLAQLLTDLPEDDDALLGGGADDEEAEGDDLGGEIQVRCCFLTSAK